MKERVSISSLIESSAAVQTVWKKKCCSVEKEFCARTALRMRLQEMSNAKVCTRYRYYISVFLLQSYTQ